jgi:hypothetical protein
VLGGLGTRISSLLDCAGPMIVEWSFNNGRTWQRYHIHDRSPLAVYLRQGMNPYADGVGNVYRTLPSRAVMPAGIDTAPAPTNTDQVAP